MSESGKQNRVVVGGPLRGSYSLKVWACPLPQSSGAAILTPNAMAEVIRSGGWRLVNGVRAPEKETLQCSPLPLLSPWPLWPEREEVLLGTSLGSHSKPGSSFIVFNHCWA